jgi:hypothetical protein
VIDRLQRAAGGTKRIRVTDYLEHDAPLPPIAVGRDDHRPFYGTTELPELQRLARYSPIRSAEEAEGMPPEEVGAFSPVDVDDLEDVPRVYVFVHGWVPGSRSTADLMFAQRGDIAMAWDAQVTNVVGETMVDSYTPLLDALSDRDPEAAVLWFSWVDQSGTDIGLFSARQSLRNTEVNGRRLATALSAALGENTPQIHLIGHSHGCVVSTHAALSLPSLPQHLTLLDCPEGWFSRAGGAAGLLDDILPRLQPGRGTGQVFVDSYISMFGRAYHDQPGLADVVDVWLRPQFSPSEEASAVSQAHQYPVRWYAESVTDPDADVGFAWSPLHGADNAGLAASYLKVGRGHTLQISSRRPEPTTPQVQSRSQVTVNVDAELTRSEPDLLLSMSPGKDTSLLEFDYEIRRPGRSTRLEAAVDRQLCFVAAAHPQVHARGRYLRINAEEDQTTLVQFRLVNPGLFTTVSINRIRLIRTHRRPRNYDDWGASATFAMLGAAAGSAATLLLVGVVVAVRRLTSRGE